MKNKFVMSLMMLPLVAAPLTSCREKGPAEKVGESLDRAAEDIKDTVNPKGPAEKAGEKIDNALGK